MVPYGFSTDNNTALMLLITAKLRDFSDDDYVLPIGDPALMVAVSSVASKINGDKVKILRWDRRKHNYRVVNLDLRIDIMENRNG